MSSYIRKIENTSEINKLLIDTFVKPEFRSAFVEIGPTNICMPQAFEVVYEEIKAFPVREDDVFVAAFPKTGTRWTQEMVWLLVNNLDYAEAEKVKLDDRCILLESDGLVAKFGCLDKIKAAKSPRCIRTHLHWSVLPENIEKFMVKPKIIVVFRNPEDVCVSLYHQSKSVEGYSGTFEEFCDLFLAGKVPNAPFHQHAISFWKQKEKANICFIHYETMKTDLESVIREIATFLGKSVSQEEVTELSNFLTFDTMKNREAFNNTEFLKKYNMKGNPFVRSGQIGSHKTVMTPEILEKFKRWREDNFSGTGITFN